MEPQRGRGVPWGHVENPGDLSVAQGGLPGRVGAGLGHEDELQ